MSEKNSQKCIEIFLGRDKYCYGKNSFFPMHGKNPIIVRKNIENDRKKN